MKYLLLIAFIAIVWWVWQKRVAQPGRNPTPAARDPEAMVNCAHCGVYLPRSDSIVDGDAYYCSQAHRRAAKAPSGHA